MAAKPSDPAMMGPLGRFLRPRRIAVIGGGAWCRQVLAQNLKMGFDGALWPVHPRGETLEGLPVYRSVRDLPAAPDAAFVGVNRHATPKIVAELAAQGAGGAVCFASGFQEAAAQQPEALSLHDQLLEAAGDMPLLGPNCYGFLNYLDGSLLWPDEHGGRRQERGVAVVMQSSNMAVNLTMQRRGLPLGYLVAVGNQAQIDLARMGEALLADDRITALGLHIEGIGCLDGFQSLAARAQALRKPVVALKVGASPQAQAATVSHTASMAGSDAGATALLHRLGIARVPDLPSFCETLKLLHTVGRLPPSRRIASLSCSGGEASLMADMGQRHGLHFPPLPPKQRTELRQLLGPAVALANPLDYHTYIWRDAHVMARVFGAVMGMDVAITLVVVDFPRADRCDLSDWHCVIEAAMRAHRQVKKPLALVATLPELMPEDIAAELEPHGIGALCGLAEALAACQAASIAPPMPAPPLRLPHRHAGPSRVITEAKAKALLAPYGLPIPRAQHAPTPEAAAKAAQAIGFPVVLKGVGIAHKSEAAAIVLDLNTAQAVRACACSMAAPSFLVEEMVGNVVAELLVGVVHDAAHGYVMTLAAGGILAELMTDSVSLLLPAPKAMVQNALESLRLARILAGYRGRPAADRPAILHAIAAVQAYALDNAEGLLEIEINPLLCTPTGAVAGDALLRRNDPLSENEAFA